MSVAVAEAQAARAKPNAASAVEHDERLADMNSRLERLDLVGHAASGRSTPRRAPAEPTPARRPGRGRGLDPGGEAGGNDPRRPGRGGVGRRERSAAVRGLRRVRPISKLPGMLADPNAPDVTDARTSNLMCRLFACFEDCFCCLTGSTPELFTSGQSLHAALAALYNSLAADEPLDRQRRRSYEAAEARLIAFYNESKTYLFAAAQRLVGLKLVLGGKQAFLADSLDSVRSMALYSDTIAIPDPIYRYFEMIAEGKRVTFMPLLEDLYHILQLKPLVDAALDVPPVIVFPSYEYTFEQKDELTRAEMDKMYIVVFGHLMKASYNHPSDIFDHARRSPLVVPSVVESNQLIVGFGNQTGDDFAAQMAGVREYYRVNGASDERESLSDPELALVLMMERLRPLYHLVENANEFNASPLMTQLAHWQYYKLMGKANEAFRIKTKSSDMFDVIEPLSGQEHRWLGNVPIDVLVQLRARGENQDFRRKVLTQIEELRKSTPGDFALTSAMVSRTLDLILLDHAKELKRLRDKYEFAYAPQAVASWYTIAAWFFPTLLPALPMAVPIMTYFGTKVAETVETRRANQSLTGILAASARAAKN